VGAEGEGLLGVRGGGLAPGGRHGCLAAWGGERCMVDDAL